MTEHQFWKLIAESRENLPSCEEQSQRLQELLCTLPPEEIISFDEIFFKKRHDAYRWYLWGVAYIINGGCSDDGFEYFRSWLIGQGKEAYERVLQDPENIVDLFDEDDEELECEDLMGAAYYAYQDVVGQEMPSTKRDYSSPPQGDRWNEDDLQRRFPKVCKKCHH
jgi:hypothetical protein